MLLSPGQARTVLKRLTDAGELELRGEHRGAHYVRAARAVDTAELE